MMQTSKEYYQTKCEADGNCIPQPKLRTYSSGGVHCVTQCDTCGCTFGSPFSRKAVDPSIEIKPFDEDRLSRFYEEKYKDSPETNEIQYKLYAIRKRLKEDHFKHTLNLPFDDFKSSYEAYLASPHWQEKRKVILARDNYTCQYCLQAKATQVHHLSYHNLGMESNLELLSVCITCHNTIHRLEESAHIWDRSQLKEL